MGTYTFLNGKKIKFWKVEYLNEDEFKEKYNISLENNLDNGTVILSDDKKGLFIKAKNGILKVLEIQGENARKMNINDFLRGNKIKVGDKFE